MPGMIALLLNLRFQKLPVRWYFYHFFSAPLYLTGNFHIIAGSQRHSAKGNSSAFLPAPSHPLLHSAEIIQLENFSKTAFSPWSWGLRWTLAQELWSPWWGWVVLWGGVKAGELGTSSLVSVKSWTQVTRGDVPSLPPKISLHTRFCPAMSLCRKGCPTQSCCVSDQIIAQGREMKPQAAKSKRFSKSATWAISEGA